MLHILQVLKRIVVSSSTLFIFRWPTRVSGTVLFLYNIVSLPMRRWAQSIFQFFSECVIRHHYSLWFMSYSKEAMIWPYLISNDVWFYFFVVSSWHSASGTFMAAASPPYIIFIESDFFRNKYRTTYQTVLPLHHIQN